VSRLAFRAPVTSPRPRAAIAMVALATATLAVTGQVATPLLLAAAAAIAFVTLRRGRASPWQMDGRVLNAGLAGAVALGVWIYVEGALAMVAFAHFVVLAQALQLLDARPRRSEFLLVALAVSQVVLAANLTDSAFFPLLLVAFTGSVVWTLLVHTLRAEAIEAGEPEAAHAVVSTGLRRTTLLAFAGTTLLATLLFPTLPRLHSGSLLSTGMGRAQAVSGFSDEVALGDLGRIRMDPSVMLRVETLEGELAAPEARYWRGLAFDHFDGRRWSVTPRGRTRVGGDPEIGVGFPDPPAGERLVQRIAREAVPSGVLFSAGRPTGLRGPVGRLERDANGALYAHRSADRRVDYRVATRTVAGRDDAALARDRAVAPARDGGRSLQLPELTPAIGELARRIAGEAEGGAVRAALLERYLRQNGRYSDTPPTQPPDDPRSPVERFLLEDTEGHCEYFATSMVVLARSLGLPARLVNGFAGGTANEVGGFVELSQADAHTWVEIHYEQAGWVRYDPTPPDLRLAGAQALRGARSFGELLSALELWWFRNVVDFDRGHQTRAVRGLWRSWQRWRAEARRERGGGEPGPGKDAPGLGLPTPDGPAVWLGLAALAALLVGADLRRRARRRQALPPFYARALRLLARRGLRRDPATSARAFARQAAQALPPPAGRAFAALTEAYLAERFGGHAADGTREELAALRAALRARRVSASS
jgi:transglutaminase-like putative cysteine protease